MSTGTLLDGMYELKEELGRGASGTVYRAFSTRIQQDVAIKILHNGNQILAHRDRLWTEFQALYRLAAECAHLVRVLDFNDGTKGNCSQAFLVMEYLSGETLQSALRRAITTASPLTISLIVDVFYQTGLAIQVAHSQKILHRDLKPENIFLTRGGSQPIFTKVLDFGLAKIMGHDATRLSMPNTFMGTPAYASPEAAQTLPLSEQSDIYSLGCVVYELLCGHPPFMDADAYALLKLHITARPTPVSEKRADCPKYLADLVMAMLGKNPHDRPQGMAPILDALLKKTWNGREIWEIPTILVPARRGRPNDTEGRTTLKTAPGFDHDAAHDVDMDADLAHISHHPSATSADLRAYAGRAPKIVLDRLQACLRAIFVRAPSIHGHLDAVAANAGEKCGLAQVPIPAAPVEKSPVAPVSVSATPTIPAPRAGELIRIRSRSSSHPPGELPNDGALDESDDIATDFARDRRYRVGFALAAIVVILAAVVGWTAIFGRGWEKSGEPKAEPTDQKPNADSDLPPRIQQTGSGGSTAIEAGSIGTHGPNTAGTSELSQGRRKIWEWAWIRGVPHESLDAEPTNAPGHPQRPDTTEVEDNAARGSFGVVSPKQMASDDDKNATNESPPTAQDWFSFEDLLQTPTTLVEVTPPPTKRALVPRDPQKGKKLTTSPTKPKTRTLTGTTATMTELEDSKCREWYLGIAAKVNTGNCDTARQVYRSQKGACAKTKWKGIADTLLSSDRCVGQQK